MNFTVFPPSPGHPGWVPSRTGRSGRGFLDIARRRTRTVRLDGPAGAPLVGSATGGSVGTVGEPRVGAATRHVPVAQRGDRPGDAPAARRLLREAAGAGLFGEHRDA